MGTATEKRTYYETVRGADRHPPYSVRIQRGISYSKSNTAQAMTGWGHHCCDLSQLQDGHRPNNLEKAEPLEISATVTAITARSVLDFTISTMGWNSLSSKHWCPSCGGLMRLTRTIAASSGFSELRTYGCRECGVWVTEGSPPKDQLEATFIVRK